MRSKGYPIEASLLPAHPSYSRASPYVLLILYGVSGLFPRGAETLVA